MPKARLKPYESLVLCLAFGCPYGEEREGCPMAECRKLPLETRLKVIIEMVSEDQRAIYMMHRICLAEREGKPIEIGKTGLRKAAEFLRSKKEK